jgi:hypothetical protein
MGFSFSEDSGDGVNKVFAFSFSGKAPGYISQDDIHVYVDDVEVFGFSFPTDNTVQLLVAPGEPADPAIPNVVIRRIMDKDQTYHDYGRGNIFQETILNGSFRQNLYSLHELMDGYMPSGYFLKENQNMRGYRFTDMGEGIDPGDSTTLGQQAAITDALSARIDSTESASASAAAAAASAAAALVSENAAAADVVLTHADVVLTNADVVTAEAHKDAAAASAAEALATEGRIAAAGDAELADIAAAGDAELVDIAAAGDTELAEIAAAGDDELSQIAAAGDAEIADVIAQGAIEEAELNAIVAAANVNKTVRQTMLAGPDMEATPSTIETAATKTGDLRSTYHDLSMDMQTGSRGGMVLTKDKGVNSNILQASILTNARSRLITDSTAVITDSVSEVQQLLANGVQLGDNARLTSANLAAFQTTKKTALDGNEWHYNPESGFAMCKYVGTGAAFNLRHPMGKVPLFWAVKNLASAVNWATGRIGTEDFMKLNTTDAEAAGTIWNNPPTDTYIGIDTGGGLVNVSGQEHFLFGWFGDPLDDLEVGMVGERGVTAGWVYTGGSGAMSVDTGITDIQTVILKKTTGTGSWVIHNKAAGWDNWTVLNGTNAEASGGSITVTGSTLSSAGYSDDYLIIAIGSTANAPDNKLKASTKLLRKVGTAAADHRVDLGAAFSGGNNGGMFFGRPVGSIKDNAICDTIQGIGKCLFTSSTAVQQSISSVVSAFTTTGITVGNSGYTNPAELNQYTAFNTTHKITTGDGLNWEYNPLTGFAMCKYIGNGTAGRTLTHPMGKKLRMGWFKNLETVVSWIVYMDSLGATGRLNLDNTNAFSTSIAYFNDTEPTDTTITLGTANNLNEDTKEHVFYGWFGDDLSDISTGLTGERGVSAFWQYTGGSGAMSVDTGIDNIELILAKVSSSTGEWFLRSEIDGVGAKRIAISSTAVEADNTAYTVEGSVVSYTGGASDAEFIAFGSKADSGVDNDVIVPATVSDPAIFSMANGFDNSVGNVDIIKALTASTTLNITGAEGRKFIYMKADGLLYFTDQRPVYSRNAVIDMATSDGHVYSIDEAKMYNASDAVEAAVFIGECWLDNLGNVYDIRTYAKGDFFESDPFSAIVETSYYLNHPFGHHHYVVQAFCRNTEEGHYYWRNTHFGEDNGVDKGIDILIYDARDDESRELRLITQTRIWYTTAVDQNVKYIARRTF